MTGPRTAKEICLRGMGVSPGIAVGPVLPVSRDEEYRVERTLEDHEIPGEIHRFEEALIATRGQLRAIQERVTEAIGTENARIFDAHLLVLEDEAFLEEILRAVQERSMNIEQAVHRASTRYADLLADMNDEYLRERASDVRDVGRRMLRNLAGHQPCVLSHIEQPCLVVSVDLAPSETAVMERNKVIGFATDLGSPSSHTAIMARALEIPAVVGLRDLTSRVREGDTLLLDGTKGLVFIHPCEETLRHYGELASLRKRIMSGLDVLRDAEPHTLDEHPITLSANIELPSDVQSVREHGGHGVGLFRTEYLYLTADHLPGEEEQQEQYEHVLKAMAPHPVTFRTMDLGGDKFAANVRMTPELNPFLGWRGIRFCLTHRDVFKTQLRAILRASPSGCAKLMFPMISDVGEVLEALAILEEVRADLRSEKLPFQKSLEVGVMVEVPSAALTAHLIAPHVQFFSLGTNDLVQYTLAVDRVNERIAHLYQPTHPAILFLIRRTVEAARAQGVAVSACGEMAGHPVMAPLLVGLGVHELSVSPAAIPLIKKILLSLRLEQVRALADEALGCSSSDEVLRRSRALVEHAVPEIIPLLD